MKVVRIVVVLLWLFFFTSANVFSQSRQLDAGGTTPQSSRQTKNYTKKITLLMWENKKDLVLQLVQKKSQKIYNAIKQDNNFGAALISYLSNDKKSVLPLAKLFFSENTDYEYKFSLPEEIFVNILIDLANKSPESFNNFITAGCASSWFSCGVRFNELIKKQPQIAENGFTVVVKNLGINTAKNILTTLDTEQRETLLNVLQNTNSEILQKLKLDKNLIAISTKKNNNGFFKNIFYGIKRFAGRTIKVTFQKILGSGPFVEKYKNEKQLKNGLKYTVVYGVRDLRVDYPVEVQFFTFDLSRYNISPFFNTKDEKQLGKNDTVAVLSGTYWRDNYLPIGTFIQNGKVLTGTKPYIDYNLTSKLYGEGALVIKNNGKIKILNLKKMIASNKKINFKEFKGFVQGGPVIVEDGKITTKWVVPGEANNGADTFAAIGLTADNKVIFATTKTFTNEETGITYQELAKLMIKQGAKFAMCIDGGGLEGVAVAGVDLKNRIPLTKNVFLIKEKKLDLTLNNIKIKN